MKIMSFNTQHCLNFIERKIDFEIMAKTIMEQGADIVGLNEMRGEGVDPDYTPQVDKLAELTGMPYFFFAPAIYVENKGLYGNGFLSRIPIIKAENISLLCLTKSMKLALLRCFLAHKVIISFKQLHLSIILMALGKL